MDPVLVRFLEKFPSAEVAAAATVEEMTQVVAPLGLQERRPVAIIRFSREEQARACFFYLLPVHPAFAGIYLTSRKIPFLARLPSGLRRRICS